MVVFGIKPLGFRGMHDNDTALHQKDLPNGKTDAGFVSILDDQVIRKQGTDGFLSVPTAPVVVIRKKTASK